MLARLQNHPTYYENVHMAVLLCLRNIQESIFLMTVIMKSHFIYCLCCRDLGYVYSGKNNIQWWQGERTAFQTEYHESVQVSVVFAESAKVLVLGGNFVVNLGFSGRSGRDQSCIKKMRNWGHVASGTSQMMKHDPESSVWLIEPWV